MFIRIMRSNNFRGQWESFLQFILTECFQPLGKCTRNVKWNGNNKNHQTTCLRIKSFLAFSPLNSQLLPLLVQHHQKSIKHNVLFQ